MVRTELLIINNSGDVKPGEGCMSELRINYGPGYRVYYLRKGTELSTLLAG